ISSTALNNCLSISTYCQSRVSSLKGGVRTIAYPDPLVARTPRMKEASFVSVLHIESARPFNSAISSIVSDCMLAISVTMEWRPTSERKRTEAMPTDTVVSMKW
ncbi:hypothetical protein PMAYCL1PPCAC_15590, partial [Pristionchus mayeri]